MSELILSRIRKVGLVLKHLNYNKYYTDQKIQRIMMLNVEIKYEKQVLE